MKMKSYVLLMSIVFYQSSCTDDNQVISSSVSSVTVKNLPGDPGTGHDPMTGAIIGNKNVFTFFRFSDSTIVQTSDSASSKWDIGFRSYNIIVNSSVSGPGNAGAFIYNGLFSELKEVPTDSTFKQDVSTADLVIGSKWSTYVPAAMILLPTPGKVLVIHTADNKYVKMEILSYYKDEPTSPNAFVDKDRYYTFRYVYQTNGSKKFE